MSPALLLALVALNTDASAEPDFEYQESGVADHTPMGLGLGAVIGAPTGFTGAWRAGRSAIDGAVAWDIPNSLLHLHGDYLFTVYTLNDPLLPEVEFPFYMGVGARILLGADQKSILGVRIPLGASVVPKELSLPLEAFLEVAPVIGLYPSTGVNLDALIGVRVYPFNQG